MIDELLVEAKKTNQRRMIVTIIDELDNVKSKLKEYTLFSDDIKGARKFKEVRKIMGQTLGHVIIDARKGFLPSDFGIIIGAVSGGHLIVLIKSDPWENKKFHKWMESPNNPRGKFRDYFLAWFDKKLRDSPGIYYENYIKPRVINTESSFEIPKCNVDRRIISLSATQDQANAIAELDDSKISILIADRGRGKSSAVGLYLANFVTKSPCKVCVTSPSIDNSKEVFTFLEKGLNAVGSPYKKSNKKYVVGNSIVQFLEPYNVLKENWDLIVIDEAAAIPSSLLLRLMNKSKKLIFSTTIHGYEGGGRSFYIKFLGALKDKRVKFNTIKMNTPIRYAEGDPIERFTFDTLLLDAEPAEVSLVDLSKVNLVIPKKSELIKNEKLLREYFGIFVLAHYKNNPNDLALILDAPSHIPAFLEYSGQVVAAIHLTSEGNLNEEIIEESYEGIEINGELIADRIIRHYRMKKFGKYRGLRIVRIAVHPQHMDEGLGSLALKLIEKQFKFDWIGASFGATTRLLKFWFNNGYYPIHASPARNKVTGEYSFIVLKGDFKELQMLLNEFAKKIFNSLDETYSDLEFDIVRLIKRIHNKDRLPALTQIQWERLKAYLDGILTYEVTYDAIKEIVYSYFLNKVNLLDDETENILIARVLQGLGIHTIQNIFHLPLTAVYSRVKKGVARIFEYYQHRLSLNIID